MPSVNSETPKSKRSTPVAKWTPTVEINTPIHPAIRFLIEDFPLMEANIDNANIANPKYSTGPKLKATSANKGVAAIKITKLKYHQTH